MNSETFAVDASLLQELGERLIGRAPIALAELIKNSYDADAATCQIEFREDEIVIIDDGTGMSEQEFLQHWMRIGTTHKVDQRVSRGGRSLTGSKGIGRLSVQFLADSMELESTSEDHLEQSLLVLVDWSKVIRGRDLNTVDVLWDLQPAVANYPNSSRTGTKIVLKKLKSQWDAEALESLGREVWRLRSPFKSSLSGSVAAGSKIRRPEEFDIEIDAPAIAGARTSFDKVREILFESWKARIRGTLDQGRKGGKANITVEFKPGYPEDAEKGARFRETIALPIRHDDVDDEKLQVHQKPLVHQATFEIFIFRTEGRQPGGIPVAQLREYLAAFGNVSVYDAGFRLPYYGSGKDAAGQDWLSIALDQGRRLNTSELLPQHLRTQNKYMQDLPAPGRIFGAVDINTNLERAAAATTKKKPPPDEWLQIQPGRDRLHDNKAFRQLRDFVRFSLDFYANRHRLRALETVERSRDKEPPSRKYDRVLDTLDRNKAELPAPVFREIRREVADARSATLREEQSLDQRAALLAPLATAGITALALSHELARETRFLDRVATKLKRIAKVHAIPELAALATEFDEARLRIRSMQEVFAPLLSDVDVAATHRLKVLAVIEQTVNAMRVLMPRVAFDYSAVRKDLRFPLGSLAEWNAILQNVLANAWNAMLDTNEARVGFAGGRDKRGKEWLHVSDTGKGLGVPLSASPKLFEPFERRLKISEDKRSIAIGGHGLGLAITRMIASRRSAAVGFVAPRDGFATTFEISWKGARK